MSWGLFSVLTRPLKENWLGIMSARGNWCGATPIRPDEKWFKTELTLDLTVL